MPAFYWAQDEVWSFLLNILEEAMKVAGLFVIGLLVSSVSSADQFWDCESGNPDGGGPVASIEKADKSESYSLTVSYNRRNLESDSRSSELELEAAPTETKSVRELEMDCKQLTFTAKRGKRQIQLFLCEAADTTFLRLLNFSASTPQFDLSCQGM